MKATDLITLLRPRQWTKNLAVFAAIIFSGELTNVDAIARVSFAFVSLCLVAGALYAANDAIDAERDRAHPLKRNRPVAAGRISRAQAYGIAAVCAAFGLALSASLGTEFLAAVVGYCLLQTLYVVWLKDVVIVDMLVISMGFTIRAVAGALVIDVPVSPWLLLCTALLALFLAASKRRHELLLLGDGSEVHRPALAEYSPELLDSFMGTLSAATIASYALYTFFEPHGPGNTMMLTIPFVIYGVLRYQYLVLNKETGGRPEETLLTDRPMVINVVGWITTAVVIIYVLG